jgi:hypothetical protein
MWRAAYALISCGYTTLGRASSPDVISINLNNINDLKFYHEIRVVSLYRVHSLFGRTKAFVLSRIRLRKLACTRYRDTTEIRGNLPFFTVYDGLTLCMSLCCPSAAC